MDNAIRLTDWQTRFHHVKGCWPPLYKVRPRRIDQICNQNNYEIELAERIFVDNKLIVITNNEYPYPFNSFNGSSQDTISQHIIWIRDSEDMLVFNHIIEYVEKHWPEMDFILFENTIESRSIKTIDHFHLLIRNAEPNLQLDKLLIFVIDPVSNHSDPSTDKIKSFIDHLLHLYRSCLKDDSYDVIYSDDIQLDHQSKNQLTICYLSKEILFPHIFRKISERYDTDVANLHCTYDENLLTYPTHYKMEIWNNGEVRRYFNGLQF
jgi:hypothetical protein